MPNRDRSYHLQRAQTEVDRARDSANAAAAQVHLELARLHRELAMRDGLFLIAQNK